VVYFEIGSQGVSAALMVVIRLAKADIIIENFMLSL
jgi:hypothetical protein